MSCARCCRLVHMLGLDKIDGLDDSPPENLGPPQDWIELEERRRVFWVAFSCDSQSSIATGWPSYISSEDVSLSFLNLTNAWLIYRTNLNRS